MVQKQPTYREGFGILMVLVGEGGRFLMRLISGEFLTRVGQGCSFL